MWLALSDGVRPLPVSGQLFPFAPATIDSHPFASRSDILKSGAMALLHLTIPILKVAWTFAGRRW